MELYNKFKEVSEKYATKPAVHYKEGRKWLYFSFKDLGMQVDNFASSLKRLGVGRRGRVAILCENGPEWLISDFAINKRGAICVPIHSSSNKPLVRFILDDSDSGFLIVSAGLYEKNKSVISANKELKVIVIGDKSITGEKVFLFENMVKGHKDYRSGGEVGKNTRDSVSSLIYTSGTTGDPKGVMLTNENFLFNVKASLDAVKVTSKDRFLSFLPLSHVLERTVGSYAAIFSGASIAYAENIKAVAVNLKEIKPTIIVSVPKIFERIYEKIFANINSGNSLVKSLFYMSLGQVEGSIGGRIADKLIYRKMRAAFGGNLRFAVCGGASLNERIVRFFSHIGVRIYEGYGLTETSPVVSASQEGVVKIGTVGQPIFGVQVKIADDKEILVRGANVMLGYWKNEAATKETMTRDGWLKTGDLGFLDQDNFLTIIGRKKELITTTNGKNVSPEKIEGVLNFRPAILQSLVVGQGRSYLAAFIIPNYQEIEKILGRKIGQNDEEDEGLKRMLDKEIEKANKQLMSHERIKKYRILNRPFDIENNELTPTLKLRRLYLMSKLSDKIEDFYC